MRRLCVTVLLIGAMATTPALGGTPRWTHLNGDFHAALRFSARVWGVDYERLHRCAHSEGGHGRFVWNTQGSGAGGWFQFMPGTFAWMSNAAWKAARARKMIRPPLRYKEHDSRLGQTYTAAWAFRHGYSYHWHGWGC